MVHAFHRYKVTKLDRHLWSLCLMSSNKSLSSLSLPRVTMKFWLHLRSSGTTHLRGSPLVASAWRSSRRRQDSTPLHGSIRDLDWLQRRRKRTRSSSLSSTINWHYSLKLIRCSLNQRLNSIRIERRKTHCRSSCQNFKKITSRYQCLQHRSRNTRTL